MDQEYIIKNLIFGVLSTNFRFSGRKSQSQQKLPKKVPHFTKQFCSKNLAHFSNLNSLSIVKNILLLQNQKHVSSWRQKEKFFPARFLNSQELHSCSICKANVFLFLSISRRNFFCRNVGSFYELNSFFQAVRCLGVIKNFKIFHFK